MENRKVLVIDTDRDFCLLICYHLSKKGWECDYSQNLTEALELVESKTPDIIVADKYFHKDLEPELHSIIISSDTYDPDVFLFNFKAPYANILEDIRKLFQG